MHANGVVINFVRGINISEGSKYFMWPGGPLFRGSKYIVTGQHTDAFSYKVCVVLLGNLDTVVLCVPCRSLGSIPTGVKSLLSFFRQGRKSVLSNA